MSLNGALTIATSGLQTTQRQIQVVSGNVSNANVEGYSRKTADPYSLIVGTANGGVDLNTVRREVDDFLVKEVRRAQSELSNLEAAAELHGRIQQLFGSLGSDSTLSSGLDRLKSALEAVAVEPESAAARSEVVAEAVELAQQFNRFSSETQKMRGDADKDIAHTVETANNRLREVRDLNEKIINARAVDDPTGELEDERDRALKELSEIMDIQTLDRVTGETVVMTKQGRMLVDSEVTALNFDITGNFTVGTEGNPIVLASGEELGPEIGGKLGALLTGRDETLPDFQQDLDRLSAALRDEVNAVHNQGAGNPPATELTGSRILDNGAATVVAAQGEVRIALTDPASGEIAEVRTIDLAGLGTVQDIIDEIEAAFVDEDITVEVTDDDQLRITANGLGIVIDEDTSALGGDERGLSHFFGLNDLFRTPGVPMDGAGDPDQGAALSISVREDIVANPALLAAGRLIGEDAGDIAVATGDGTVAQKLAGAFDASIDFAAGGNLDARSATLAGYAGDLLQFQAGETARLERQTDFQEGLRDELTFRAEAVSGVNIDEELTRLITLEQAFSASARVVSVVREMFDTLDAMAR